MQEILFALFDMCGRQALALQAVSDHVSALETVVKKLGPLVADDLEKETEREQKKSQEGVEESLRSLERLRKALEQMAN